MFVKSKHTRPELKEENKHSRTKDSKTVVDSKVRSNHLRCGCLLLTLRGKSIVTISCLCVQEALRASWKKFRRELTLPREVRHLAKEGQRVIQDGLCIVC